MMILLKRPSRPSKGFTYIYSDIHVHQARENIMIIIIIIYYILSQLFYIEEM